MRTVDNCKMIIKRFITFFVITALFLWMPTLTIKKDLRDMANTIVELVELVEKYQSSTDLDEKILADSAIINKSKKSNEYANDFKFLTWLLAYEVITPPPDLC